MKSKPTQDKQRLNAWLKRLGWLGFLFFLLKGLVWLYLFYWAGKLF